MILEGVVTMKYKRNFATFLTTIFFLSMPMGCRNVDELEEMISYQEEAIQTQEEAILELNDRIVELEQQQREDEQLIVDLEVEIESLNQESADHQPYVPEWQTVLADDLRENIAEIIDGFLEVDFIDSIDEILFPNSQFWTNGYVVARTSTSFPTISIVLSYQMTNDELGEAAHVTRIDDWENISIGWEVVGHIDTLNGLRFARERESRQLTDLETVMIRIYDFADITHPDWDGIWSYQEEVIQGTLLWEETLYLMPEVWDLWYDGHTLYVDLMPSQARSMGAATHDDVRAQRLARIFSSFPDVSEIRFSTFGYLGLRFVNAGNHHSAGGIFNVEEDQWVWRCELDEEDERFIYWETCPAD